MFKKYIGDISQEKTETKGEIEKIKMRVDEWDQLMKKTNHEIAELKGLFQRLERMVLAKMPEDLLPVEHTVVKVPEELSNQEQQEDGLALKIANKKINAMRIVIAQLEGDNKDNQIAGFIEKCKESEAKIDELNVEMAEILNKTNEEKKLIRALEKQICQLEDAKAFGQQRLEEFEVTINDKVEEINVLNEKIKTVGDEKAALVRQMDTLTQENAKKDKKNDMLQGMIARLEEEKNSQIQKIEQLNDVLLLIQQQNNKLENWYETYHPVMEKIYQCMALKAFVENNQLGNVITLESMLHFIKCIGADDHFAHRIHRAFSVYKREIQEPMTDQEIEVYQAINAYYKRAKKFDFDLFVLPNGLSLNDHFCDGMEFDQNEVKDIMTDGDVAFKTIRCVYVPVLRNKRKEVVDKGIVKADMHELL